jgi:aryl-alcohol dehydrogenase-like predicted oxidoreductase
MEFKTFLKNAPPVSRLGFGGWPLGNTSHGVTMTENVGVGLVRAALDAGINFFDTAPNYALGRSETILGKALEPVREKVVINTKFGHHADDRLDFSVGAIEPSVAGSIKRLRTSYIDSVLLHNPGAEILAGRTGHYEALQALKERGLIRGFGVSIDSESELLAVLDQPHLVGVIELLYNIHAQATRAHLQTIQARGIALIIKVPLDSGWLTGKFTAQSSFSGIRQRWTEADIARRADLTAELKALLSTDDLTPYALGFLCSYDPVTTVIPGIRTMQQLGEHLRAMDSPFDASLRQRLEDFHDQHIAANPLPW